MRGITLKDLIGIGYYIDEDNRVVANANWMTPTCYDIVAETSEATPDDVEPASDRRQDASHQPETSAVFDFENSGTVKMPSSRSLKTMKFVDARKIMTPPETRRLMNEDAGLIAKLTDIHERDGAHLTYF